MARRNEQPAEPRSGREPEVLLPPANVEAEEAVLGSILIDPESIVEIQHKLQANHFYRVINAWIYDAMVHLAASNIPIDIISLSEELRRRKQLDEAGSDSYLISLMSIVPTSINVGAYASIVIENALRRELIRAAETAAKAAYSEDRPITDVLAEAEKAIFDVSHKSQARHSRTISQVAQDHMEYMERLAAGGEPDVIRTGFVDMDRLLSGGGFERGMFVIVAGVQGIGKSSLVLALALNAAKAGHSAVSFSLEMPERQVYQRLMAREAHMELRDLKHPDGFNDSQWAAYYAMSGQLSGLRFYIDDGINLTPTSFGSKCRRIKAMDGLDLAIIDFMDQMQADEKTATETLRLASISRALKLLAKDLEIVIIASAKLNSKEISKRNDKHPTMDDLRNSSDPNSDADVVMLLYRDDYYNPDTSLQPNIAEVAFAKQREGATGTVDLFWQAKQMTLRNLTRQNIEFGSVPVVTSTAAKYGD